MWTDNEKIRRTLDANAEYIMKEFSDPRDRMAVVNKAARKLAATLVTDLPDVDEGAVAETLVSELRKRIN